MISSRQAYAAAFLGGTVLWLAAGAFAGRREAWDSPLYWLVAYPLCIALAAGLGYAVPERPWRWALAIMLVQPVLLVVLSGSDFSLLPLGLILFAILALPPLAAALIAAAIARAGRREKGSAPG